MRHQIVFCQYNLDKPAKYNLLFKSLNYAGLPFLYRTVVYAELPQGDPNEFHNKGTSSYIKTLVNRTKNHVSL